MTEKKYRRGSMKKKQRIKRVGYRRRRASDVWHFRSDCSNWPKKDFEARKDKPKSGELCNQCRAKARKGSKKR